jgi:hypothetical protein
LDIRDDAAQFEETPHDAWRWYNLRGACNYNRVFYREASEQRLQKKIINSRFGRILREERDRNLERDRERNDDELNDDTQCRIGYRWNKRWLNECKALSRSDMRVLVMLRTGHNRLRHFTFHAHGKGDTPMCECGNGEQHIHHLLQECSLPNVRSYRRRLQVIAQDVFQRNLNKPHNDPECLEHPLQFYIQDGQVIDAMPDRADYGDPGMYIYPNRKLSRFDQWLLQRSMCQFYKLLRRKPIDTL